MASKRNQNRIERTPPKKQTTDVDFETFRSLNVACWLATKDIKTSWKFPAFNSQMVIAWGHSRSRFRGLAHYIGTTLSKCFM